MNTKTKTKKYNTFRSYSGDWFNIPMDTYEDDVLKYKEALRNGDEKTMIHYESGQTGWKYYERNTI